MYGMYTWGDAFTPRQLVALTTFSDLVSEARERVLRDMGLTPLPPSPSKMERGLGGEARRALCRELRQQQTPAEEFFWELVRDRRFEGYKFRRQHPLSRFIADFYCPELSLAVELDGGIHAMQVERDRARDEILAQHDIRVVRIRNEGFLADPEATLAQLSDLIAHWTTQDEVVSAPTPTHADAQAYADAVATYLAIAVDRLADRNSIICSWDVSRDSTRNTFARQAIPMVWDFAEANPMSESTGNFYGTIDWVAEVVEASPCNTLGVAKQCDATTSINEITSPLISTDPPYYDNIGYADLADFFYIWLRRSLHAIYPDLFKTMLVPKAQELVATPYRFGGSKSEAQAFFETGLGKAFERMRDAQHPDYPLTVYYAFKQAEAEMDEDEGDEASSNGNIMKLVASTGWETMLEGLIRAGFTITGTWPIRTEMMNRTVGQGTNALASSIVLVCRPRPLDAPIASRRQFLNALRAELPAALKNLQRGSIAPVDLAQASIGPGMAIYSRYSKVVESDGTLLRVRTALQLINRALDEALAEQEGEYDAETRWAIAWFEQYAMNAAEYGIAETLSKAKNTSVQSLVDAGLLEARAGKVHLLKREELPEAWNPKASRLTVWEVMQRMIHELLDGKGDSGAGDILRKASAQAEVARDLAYRLYTVCERKGWAQEALAYNSLVTSWSEISRLAHREAADGSLWGATFLG
jgi:putative DNA methylase